MGLINENNTLVFIIDIQEKLLNAAFNKEVLAKNAEILTQTANILGLPILITEQYPKGLGKTIECISSHLPEDFNYIEKISFSALNTREVFEALKLHNKSQILLFGIETHICVSQTAAALAEAGFEVFIIENACGSRSEKEHRFGLERIKNNGAQIITTEIALFELLKSAKHPKFKEVQALIK